MVDVFYLLVMYIEERERETQGVRRRKEKKEKIFFYKLIYLLSGQGVTQGKEKEKYHPHIDIHIIRYFKKASCIVVSDFPCRCGVKEDFKRSRGSCAYLFEFCFRVQCTESGFCGGKKLKIEMHHILNHR